MVAFAGFGILGYCVCTLLTGSSPTWQSPNQYRRGVAVAVDLSPGGGDGPDDHRDAGDGIASVTGSTAGLFRIPNVGFPDGAGRNVAAAKARRQRDPPTKYLTHLWGPAVLPQVEHGRDGAPMIDLVSLTIAEDFLQVLHNKGLESWLRHMQNIRSVTFISRPEDLEPMTRHLRSSGLPVELPIRFFDESYFVKNYMPFGVPYAKVFQQMMKLHAFDIPGLLPNIVIMDSDTIWGQNYTFVYPNGTGSYFNNHYFKQPKDGIEIPWHCTGMDPINFVNVLLNGNGYTNLTESRREGGLPLAAPAITDRTKHPEVCDFSPYCGSPDATGDRHIAHHMLFQRDVMAALHAKAIENFGGSSLWEASMNCWNHPGQKCRGRVAEYELYYVFAACRHPSRVLDTWPIFVGSGNNCSVAEMEICAERGVLLKMCNNGADKLPWKRGECSEVPANVIDPNKAWAHPRDRQWFKHW